MCGPLLRSKGRGPARTIRTMPRGANRRPGVPTRLRGGVGPGVPNVF